MKALNMKLFRLAILAAFAGGLASALAGLFAQDLQLIGVGIIASQIAMFFIFNEAHNDFVNSHKSTIESFQSIAHVLRTVYGVKKRDLTNEQ